MLISNKEIIDHIDQTLRNMVKYPSMFGDAKERGAMIWALLDVRSVACGVPTYSCYHGKVYNNLCKKYNVSSCTTLESQITNVSELDKALDELISISISAMDLESQKNNNKQD